MAAHMTLAGSAPRSGSVRERILKDIAGPRDEALIFAASSIINEIMAPTFPGGAAVREVQTEQGIYTLRGSRVFGPDGVQPAVMVQVRALDGEVPPNGLEDDVRRRYRLTRKEARVAVLLASHRSNEQIADELCISTHTARHHTQSVLGKLGVRSRREVHEVLRQVK